MLSPERQSARVSKITNDSLTWSGTGYILWLYPYGNSKRQRVKRRRWRQTDEQTDIVIA